MINRIKVPVTFQEASKGTEKYHPRCLSKLFNCNIPDMDVWVNLNWLCWAGHIVCILSTELIKTKVISSSVLGDVSQVHCKRDLRLRVAWRNVPSPLIDSQEKLWPMRPWGVGATRMVLRTSRVCIRAMTQSNRRHTFSSQTTHLVLSPAHIHETVSTPTSLVTLEPTKLE